MPPRGDSEIKLGLTRPFLGLALQVMRLARAIGARDFAPATRFAGSALSASRMVAHGRPPLLLRPDAPWVLSFDPRSFVSICGSNENLSA